MHYETHDAPDGVVVVIQPAGDKKTFPGQQAAAAWIAAEIAAAARPAQAEAAVQPEQAEQPKPTRRIR